MTLQCSNKLQAVCLVKSGSHLSNLVLTSCSVEIQDGKYIRKSSSASTLIESKEKEWLDLHNKAQQTDVYDKQHLKKISLFFLSQKLLGSPWIVGERVLVAAFSHQPGSPSAAPQGATQHHKELFEDTDILMLLVLTILSRILFSLGGGLCPTQQCSGITQLHPYGSGPQQLWLAY